MALYPPIIASSLPAFQYDIAGSFPIEFSLSKYNSANEIQTVQLTVKRHTSNVSVVNNGNLSKTVVNYPFNKNLYNNKTQKYYIDVKQAIANFDPGVIYRIQLRFSSLSPGEASVNQYTNNASQYSEWSTVCLIMPIVKPSFRIQNLQPEEGADEESIQLSTNVADFIGIYNAGSAQIKIGEKQVPDTDENGKAIMITAADGTQTQKMKTVQIFEQRKGTQVLKKWRLRLLTGDYTKDQLDNIDDYTIVDSDWNLVSAYSYAENEQTNNIIFNCNLNYEFNRSETSTTSYNLYFQILTQNDYTEGVLYSFTLSTGEDKIGRPAGQLLIRTDEEEGYIHIKYTHPTAYDEEYSNFVLRRTSSSSNFQYWQDICFFKYGGEENLDWEYKDFTAESGIIYKYGLQKLTIFGHRGRLIQSNVCMGEWEHAFLVEGNGSTLRQLKLKYDFQISSYKTNISESKTDTIGSRYPFIRRNGSMYYRSVPCTGTISAYMDDEDWFTDNSELYGTTKISTSGDRMDQTNEDIYAEFVGDYENHVTRYNYTHERKFRERVEEFLYNNQVKLYKSMQEGNMLVKLMQVSLTPKQELGRLIYTFSGTLYEVANVHQVYWHAGVQGAAAHNTGNSGAGIYDNANADIIGTLDDYGFLNIGTYDPDLLEPTDWQIGQISSYASENEVLPVNNNVKVADIMKSIVTKYQIGKVVNGFKNESIEIKKIHIETDNPPTLIYNAAGSISNSYTGTFFEEGSPEQRILGTNVNINGSEIIISPPNNIYNLFDDNMILTNGNTFTIGQNDAAAYIPNDIYAISNFFQGTIDFLYRIKRIKDKSTQSYKTSNIIKPGYLEYEDISLNTNIINHIQSLYLEEYDEETTGDHITISNNGLRNIIIDSDPGTQIEITVTNNENTTDTSTLYVNETGILVIDTIVNTASITSLKVKGVLVNGVYKKPDILIYYEINTVKERRWTQDE